MTEPTPTAQNPAGTSSTPAGTASTAAPARERWRSFGAPALAALTVVALCLGTLLGWVAFGRDQVSVPDDSVDAGFARDMSEHHAQAILMAQLVMQRTDDPEVRRLATDIDNNQGFERGVMASWLHRWGLPLAREGERMAWMSMDMAEQDLPEGVAMPGMATPEEIEQLTAASGREAEVLFLQLMTTHHISGVHMAQDALDHARTEEVRAAAQRMVDAQSGEVTLMASMLDERGSEPREDVSAWTSGTSHGHGSTGTEDDAATSEPGGHDH